CLEQPPRDSTNSAEIFLGGPPQPPRGCRHQPGWASLGASRTRCSAETPGRRRHGFPLPFIEQGIVRRPTGDSGERVAVLRVSLLGEQTITGARTGVRARSSRAVALVAFLAVHAGSPQARQRIAGLFWPDSTEAQTLTNLRRELHQLRQLL